MCTCPAEPFLEMKNWRRPTTAGAALASRAYASAACALLDSPFKPFLCSPSLKSTTPEI